MTETVVTAIVGYLLGSIPVALMVARRAGGPDLRTAGDRNPGYWNARSVLGERWGALVLAGDLAKGAAAAGLGRWLGDGWWVGYVGGAAAMIGHCWPVFAGWRGGRGVLTFVGAAAVLSPAAAALAALGALVTALITRRPAVGIRVGVFGFPLAQLAVDPVTHVAATGALMCIIGVRFAQAALANRQLTKNKGKAGPRVRES
jgi:glycerol-3-phosphate acyltransferase PlsY